MDSIDSRAPIGFLKVTKAQINAKKLELGTRPDQGNGRISPTNPRTKPQTFTFGLIKPGTKTFLEKRISVKGSLDGIICGDNKGSVISVLRDYRERRCRTRERETNNPRVSTNVTG